MSEKWVIAKTKENLVFNFMDQLIKIGVNNKTNGLTSKHIKKLIRNGVISRRKKHGNDSLVLTPYTIRVLNDLEGGE